MNSVMPKYMEQLRRVRRMLDRIERNKGRSVDDYGDDVWSFFQNCWHLKDWIGKDSSVPLDKAAILKFVRKSQPLKICSDLANCTKHLEFDDKHEPWVDAKPSHSNITITPGESSTVEYLIDPGTGAKQDALDLARKCVAVMGAFSRCPRSSYAIDQA